MKFILDQSADARIQPHLRSRGHDVTRVARDYPGGLPDPEVLRIAHRERRILIASDLDFSALVFVDRQPHAGVILLRLGPSAPLSLLKARLDEVFALHVDALDRFIVVTHQRIRVR